MARKLLFALAVVVASCTGNSPAPILKAAGADVSEFTSALAGNAGAEVKAALSALKASLSVTDATYLSTLGLKGTPAKKLLADPVFRKGFHGVWSKRVKAAPRYPKNALRPQAEADEAWLAAYAVIADEAQMNAYLAALAAAVEADIQAEFDASGDRVLEEALKSGTVNCAVATDGAGADLCVAALVYAFGKELITTQRDACPTETAAVAAARYARKSAGCSLVTVTAGAYADPARYACAADPDVQWSAAENACVSNAAVAEERGCPAGTSWVEVMNECSAGPAWSEWSDGEPAVPTTKPTTKPPVNPPADPFDPTALRLGTLAYPCLEYAEQVTAAGPDGLWFTADDAVAGYDYEGYDATARLVEQGRVVFTGEDEQWRTVDDVLSERTRYAFAGTAEAERFEAYSSTYAVKTVHDAAGRTTATVWYEGWGTDAAWQTADDVIAFAESTAYDAAGRVTEQISGYERVAYTYDAAGAVTSESRYYDPGTDGVFGTADDLLSEYSTWTYDGQRRLTRELHVDTLGWGTRHDYAYAGATTVVTEYTGAGADGLWGGGDDEVNSILTLSAATGRILSELTSGFEYQYESPGCLGRGGEWAEAFAEPRTTDETGFGWWQNYRVHCFVTLERQIDSGVDGAYFTADDETYYAQRTTYGTGHHVAVRTSEWYTAGVLSQRNVETFLPSGYRDTALYATDPGADAVWGTGDDTLAAYTRYFFHGSLQVAANADGGQDGILGNGDDAWVDTGDAYDYDAGGFPRTEWSGASPGNDAAWGTADDTAMQLVKTYYDAAGRLTTRRNVFDPGADGVWNTADDAYLPETLYVFDAQGRATREERVTASTLDLAAVDLTFDAWGLASVDQYLAGPDGVAGGGDDVRVNARWFLRDAQGRPTDAGDFDADTGYGQRYTWQYDAAGNETQHVYYGEPGPDGAWRTADDVVSEKRTALYAQGVLTFRSSFSHWTYTDVNNQPVVEENYYTYQRSASRETETYYDGAGADAAWGTADDVVASSTDTTTDGAGNVISDYRESAYRSVSVSYAAGNRTYTEYSAPGADAAWGTADDVVALHSVHDPAGTYPYISYRGPGADAVWGNGDDLVGGYQRHEGACAP